MRLAFHTGDHDQGFAEVSLRVAGRMRQRHEHLALMQPLQPHVIFDDGVAAGESVFLFQPVEDALGRVALFAGPRFIVFQNLVDDPDPLIELGPSNGLLAPVTRRRRVAQYLAHGFACQPEDAGCLAFTLSLNEHHSSDARIQFHVVHLSGVP